uniref:Uncharacterized protein n=1 Tax=Romanomermis culicivorax TaxID=13658 RepID=A0A915I696_ROMCU
MSNQELGMQLHKLKGSVKALFDIVTNAATENNMREAENQLKGKMDGEEEKLQTCAVQAKPDSTQSYEKEFREALYNQTPEDGTPLYLEPKSQDKIWESQRIDANLRFSQIYPGNSEGDPESSSPANLINAITTMAKEAEKKDQAQVLPDDNQEQVKEKESNQQKDYNIKRIIRVHELDQCFKGTFGYWLANPKEPILVDMGKVIHRWNISEKYQSSEDIQFVDLMW